MTVPEITLRQRPALAGRRVALGAVGAIGVLLAVVFAREAIVELFPRMDIRVAELLVLGIAMVGGNIGYQLHLGRRYALINVYSGIFFSEYIVGSLVAVARGDVLNKQHLSTDTVVAGLGIALAGYALLSIGYHLPSLLPGRKNVVNLETTAPASDDFPVRYRIILFLLLGVLIWLGFIQLMLRVQKAGGFANYLAIAYTLRYGTYADSDTSNAGAVLASLLAAGGLPCAALLFIAWMRKKLSGFEKWLLVIMTAALLARQASTAFRAVVVFTLMSAFAVYDSERRVGRRTLLIGGALLTLSLVGVNYIHVMLHTLTGMGTTTSFADASQELMAPHNYLETLTTVLDARGRLDALDGQGMLTSILYFIPRAIWTSKVPSDEYGTGLVQGWAGLTTTYQMAVTNVGELVVHFGLVGLTALLIWGLIYRWLDDRWWHGLEWRMALLCIGVPRVFPDQGMGLSAFVISVTSIAGFMVPLVFLKYVSGLRHHTSTST